MDEETFIERLAYYFSDSNHSMRYRIAKIAMLHGISWSGYVLIWYFRSLSLYDNIRANDKFYIWFSLSSLDSSNVTFFEFSNIYWHFFFLPLIFVLSVLYLIFLKHTVFFWNYISIQWSFRAMRCIAPMDVILCRIGYIA